MKDRFKLTEVWFKLVLLAFFIFLYFLSIPYPEKAKRFPLLIIILSLIMIVISLVIDFTRKETVARVVGDVDDTELKVIDDTTRRTKRKRFYQAWGIILVSTAIGFLGGFLFSTFFLFVGFALFFGKRTKKMIVKNFIIAIGMTIVIYFIFEWIMHVPLLAGIFW